MRKAWCNVKAPHNNQHVVCAVITYMITSVVPCDGCQGHHEREEGASGFTGLQVWSLGAMCEPSSGL